MVNDELGIIIAKYYIQLYVSVELSYKKGRKAVKEKNMPIISNAILWSLKKAVNASAKTEEEITKAAK